jgi:hypothetical protein
MRHCGRELACPCPSPSHAVQLLRTSTIVRTQHPRSNQLPAPALNSTDTSAENFKKEEEDGQKRINMAEKELRRTSGSSAIAQGRVGNTDAWSDDKASWMAPPPPPAAAAAAAIPSKDLKVQVCQTITLPAEVRCRGKM